MSIRLIPPCLDYQQSYCEYIDELGDEVRYPFTLDFDHSDFETLLQRLANHANGIDIPEGFAAHSTFWLVDDHELLGVSNLRHMLTDRLRQHGGHIGLGMRPSRRGQGMGRMLLARTIEQARLRGIGEIHIHCHKSNAASAAMIRSNGGVLVTWIELCLAGSPTDEGTEPACSDQDIEQAITTLKAEDIAEGWAL